MESLESILLRYMDWTDKERNHRYFTNYYGKAFEKYRERENVIVEVGVGGGGAIQIFNDYFINSQIYGLEINPEERLAKIQNENPRIHLIVGDGYSDSIVSQVPDIDIFIDDGRHVLEDQAAALEKYLPKMKPGGLFVIEDLGGVDRAVELTERVPDNLKPYIKVIERQQKDGGNDQLLFVIEIPN